MLLWHLKMTNKRVVESKSWWEDAVFFEVYVSKFFDSNEDGIGDICGIISKLDHLKELGIDAIWITPFYPHSHADGGYDVSCYQSVSKEYGTMNHFMELIKKAHALDIKVIIDLVVNHSSTQHIWFQKSENSVKGYEDFYVWRKQPNNWESFFSGNAWVYSPIRNEYYYSSFSDSQADLNWMNPEVMYEFKKIIEYWVDLGIDGFRFDVINNLTTDNNFSDNPYFNYQQVHLNDIDKTNIKSTLKSLFSDIPKHIVKIGEISSNKAHKINSYLENNLFDLCFNFNFLDIHTFDAPSLYREIKETEETLQDNRLPTLVFSSHDAKRILDRLASFDLNKAQAIAFFLLTAKGVPFIYQGDELGNPGKSISSLEDIEDVQGINAYKTELKKHKDKNKAFKIAKEKSRDNSRNFVDFNLNKNSKHIYKTYKELISIRKNLGYASSNYENVICYGDMLMYERGNFRFILNLSDKELLYKNNESEIVLYSTQRKEINYLTKIQDKVRIIV